MFSLLAIESYVLSNSNTKDILARGRLKHHPNSGKIIFKLHKETSLAKTSGMILSYVWTKYHQLHRFTVAYYIVKAFG
jgi:hypothetical protein